MRKVLVTTTLIVVLFTTIVLGGGTLPLVKYLVICFIFTHTLTNIFRKVEVVQETGEGAAKRILLCPKPRNLAPWTVNICQVLFCELG